MTENAFEEDNKFIHNYVYKFLQVFFGSINLFLQYREMLKKYSVSNMNTYSNLTLFT